MYDYRKMSPEQRKYVVDLRRKREYPWHGPPHLDGVANAVIVSAACYEHKPILGTRERLAWFEQALLDHLHDTGIACIAWCVLPNHYHVLLREVDTARIGVVLGGLHGRTSREMNCEDHTLGRKVWYRCQDRRMRSDRHLHVSRNYIHHNPVRHGGADKWQAWPFSSVHWYMEHRGRDWLLAEWRNYPLKNFGLKWDNFGRFPEMSG